MAVKELVQSWLDKGVEDGVFSGAQAAVAVTGQEPVVCVAGLTAWERSQPLGRSLTPITPRTRFDLASLTKAMVTAPLCWYALAQGLMAPDDPVSRWLPDWAPGARAGVTLRHLLSHTSGLPAWNPLYQEANHGGTTMQRLLLTSELMSAPGQASRYSDVGYMLLGLLLERCLGGRLDQLARAIIFEPLGQQGCCFVRHLEGARLEGEVAATEATSIARQGPALAGEVHDENAWIMGGVAGHAGLFGTAWDVLLFGQALLAADIAPPAAWPIPSSMVRWALSKDAGCHNPRGLWLGPYLGGLDTPSGDRSTAGPRMSQEPPGATVGHLGFTGTSVWVERTRRLVVALLTNRVHPDRHREGIRDFRVGFHDQVVRAAAPKAICSLPAAGLPLGRGARRAPRLLLHDQGRRPLEVAIGAARRAGALARQYLEQGRDLQITHKGDVDLVTKADIACQHLLVDLLTEACPQYGVLAEEEGQAASQHSQGRWIVDPIDGTTNFSHRLPHFGICVALEIAGQLQLGVIYDPMRDELFWCRRHGGAWLNGHPIHASRCLELDQALVATGFPYDRRTSPNNNVPQLAAAVRACQGVRRAGAASLDLAWLAAGRLDAYWETRLNPWDLAAGALLVEEAGGRVTHPDAQPFDLSSGEILATNGALHDAMVHMLAGARRQPGS